VNLALLRRRFSFGADFLSFQTYIAGTMSRVDPPGRRWSVLVVDDDPGVQGLFSTLLMRDGFSVDCAPNGRLAFEYLKRRSYSVILLDLMMPDVNGFELLERLERESPALLRRVIVLTGASQRVVEGLDESRVWGLIRKPFDINALLASAKRCAIGVAGRSRSEARGHTESL
jgi:DNA-binding response OmpR family regulator